jgi:sulfur-carrier protein adenylyltransferase/sulfurtransferase
LIGVVQATEAVKLLLGKGEPLIGRLLTYDALGMRFREVRLRRDPKCPLCGESPRILDLSIHAETSEACAITGSAGGHAAPAPAAAPTGPQPVGAPWSGVTAGC